MELITKNKTIQPSEKISHYVELLIIGLQHIKSEKIYKDIYDALKKGDLTPVVTDYLLGIYEANPEISDIDKKTLRILTEQNLAATQSEWFKQTASILNTDRSYKLTHGPAESLDRLLGLIIEKHKNLITEEQDRYLQLLKTGLEKLGIIENYRKIIHALSANAKIEPNTAINLLKLCESNPQSLAENKGLIGEAYLRILNDWLTSYYWNEEKFNKTQKLAKKYLEPALRILPMAYGYNPEKAHEIAKTILSKTTKEFINFHTITNLLSLKELDQPVFEEIVREISMTKLDQLMEVFSANPSLAEQAENTPLGIKNIFKFTVDQLSQIPSETGTTKTIGRNDLLDAFRYFFQPQFSDFINKHEDELIPYLYSILVNNTSAYDIFIKLLNTPSKKLNDAVFSAIVGVITKSSVDILNNKWLIDDLFDLKKDCSYLLEQPIDAYNNLYKTFKENDSIYVLQKLWAYMAEISDLYEQGALDTLLYEQISDFFLLGKDNIFRNNPSKKFGDIISTIMLKSIDENNLSKKTLHHFMEVAKETKFANFINNST